MLQSSSCVEWIFSTVVPHFFLLTMSMMMFWQHSQYGSRLGFSFRVLVRVRLGLG